MVRTERKTTEPEGEETETKTTEPEGEETEKEYKDSAAYESERLLWLKKTTEAEKGEETTYDRLKKAGKSLDYIEGFLDGQTEILKQHLTELEKRKNENT